MFICAHPSIATDIRTPLILQTILGLDAVKIGRAFLIAPSTIGQRVHKYYMKLVNIQKAELQLIVPLF